jgi:hypothetical protein
MKKHSILMQFTGAAVLVAALVSGCSANPPPGEKIFDGTIAAGVSPDTGREMFTTPANAEKSMPWDEAKSYCDKLVASEHSDWRLPTLGELETMYDSRREGALAGTLGPASSLTLHWSATEHEGATPGAWVVFGSDQNAGMKAWTPKYSGRPVRCVRG